MKTTKWMPATAMTAVILLGVTSCSTDWGKMDPPAGVSTFPTLENVATYEFEDEKLDPMIFKIHGVTDDAVPALAEDERKGNVLSLPAGGWVVLHNPLNQVTCQEAASLTFWMKQIPAADVAEDGTETVAPQDLASPIFSFTNENENARLNFSANGWLDYVGADGEWSDNNPADFATGYMPHDQWNYVALTVRNDGYDLYVNGEKKVAKNVDSFDCSKLVAFMNSVPNLTIGSADATEAWMIDDLKVYRNALTSKEVARPYLPGDGGDQPGPSASAVEPVYFNSFDADMGNSYIKGGGSILYVGGAFGNVFSNAMNGMRENYLVLPSDAFSHSADTQAFTIGVWVNRGNETESSHYNWCPLISAYANEPSPDNGMPMFVAQYRGLLQLNCEGWSDYTDAQNVNGANKVYHNDTQADWLADGNWHYYTATITPTTAKVYFDGEVVNEWEIDGTNNTAAGFLSHGNQLTHICLGGNQAWNWGDPDPGFWFDDIAIYNQELSQEQIKSIISLKKDAIYGNTFSNNEGDATLMGDGQFINNSTPGFGKIFKNAVGGTRVNYLLLPSWALSGVNDTEELTVNVWLNSTDAGDYYWNPVFTAFADFPGGNGCPMIACQYRGVVSVNTNGPDNSGDTWCDYTDAQNDAGANVLYNGDLDWLADKNWHLYTAVFTPTTAIVYFDGNVANSWTLDGVSRGSICDLKVVSQLKCICLGGNQAWGWGDPDPGFGFDDIMIYNKALTPEQIKQIMYQKK